MNLYLAIDTETGEVKAFVCEENFKRFANKHEYAYDYFEVDSKVYPIDLSELKNS